MDDLKKIPRQYGLPVSLRRTIEHLYQVFAATLGDPFLFDSVLDLYDAFATFHAILVKYLPELRRQETGRGPKEELGALDQGRVEQLAHFVDALQNALSHRIQKAYPEPHIRETGIDFRAGLNQTILASDAVLTSGVGLLRRHAWQNDEKNTRTARTGAVAHISPLPGVGCYPLELGTEKDAILAFF